MEAQATTRELSVLRTPHTPEHELAKGEALGMRSMLALPHAIIDEIEARPELSEDKGDEDVSAV